MSDDDELWTESDLADFTQTPPSRWRKARVTGIDTPPHIKLGHLVRYRKSDVMAWLNGNLRSSTSEQVAA